jgi:hypothetical protein
VNNSNAAQLSQMIKGYCVSQIVGMIGRDAKLLRSAGLYLDRMTKIGCSMHVIEASAVSRHE